MWNIDIPKNKIKSKQVFVNFNPLSRITTTVGECKLFISDSIICFLLLSGMDQNFLFSLFSSFLSHLVLCLYFPDQDEPCTRHGPFDWDYHPCNGCVIAYRQPNKIKRNSLFPSDWFWFVPFICYYECYKPKPVTCEKWDMPLFY